MKIAFDFDGCLVDSMPALRQLGTTIIQDFYGLDPADADKSYMKTVGRAFDEQLRTLFVNVAGADEYYERQAEAYESVRLHAGVLETIEFLNTTPIQYCLVTSTRSALAAEVLKRLLPEFAGPITGRDTGTKANQLRSHLDSQDRAERWFIGDTPYDADVARGVKVNFIGVSHTFPRASFSRCEDSIPTAVDEVLRGLPAPVQTALDRNPILPVALPGSA